MELIWERRLDRSRTLLSRRTGTISEVAYGVGFKSVAHFSNRFRDTFGCSPSEFCAREAPFAVPTERDEEQANPPPI